MRKSFAVIAIAALVFFVPSGRTLAQGSTSSTCDLQSIDDAMTTAAVHINAVNHAMGTSSDWNDLLNYLQGIDRTFVACLSVGPGPERDAALALIYSERAVQARALVKLQRTVEAYDIASSALSDLNSYSTPDNPALSANIQAAKNAFQDVLSGQTTVVKAQQVATAHAPPQIHHTTMQYTVNGIPARSEFVDHCRQIARHDDMANCYFATHQWSKVIYAYKTTPRGSLTYANDEAQNAAFVRSFYQEAVADKNLGNDSDASTFIYLARTFPQAQQDVTKVMWNQILADYNSWVSKSQQADWVAQKRQAESDAAWAKQSGMSAEEVSLVKYRGRPCHIENFESGDNYQVLTFWYCNSDGGYEESYTFTNGHQTAHYEP